jgi:hypothetical protein
MATAPRYVEVEFGATRIKFYPLTLLQIQDLQDELSAVTEIRRGANPFDPLVFAKLVRLYTASAKRGSEAITEAQVGALIDLDTMPLVNRAVLGVMTAADAPQGGPPLVPTSPQTGGAPTPA